MPSLPAPARLPPDSEDAERLRAIRRDSGVRRVVASWRVLTGGRGVRDAERRTLVACSGGADSSCLAIALTSAAPGSIVLAHVRHDLRASEAADRDRAVTAALAARLGIACAHADVRVREMPGNAEANARRARYEALAALARAHDCGFVATGHHADDQLETVLMRLLRGSGGRGLGGVRERRALAPGFTLVRPMLGLTRGAAEAVCAGFGHVPAFDATNADRSRLRARLRAEVHPVLAAIAPGVSGRVGEAARLASEAHEVVRDAARALRARAVRPAGEGVVMLDRATLRAAREVVVAEVLRGEVVRLGGGRGADRLPARTLRQAAARVRGASTEPARWNWRYASVEIRHDGVWIGRMDAGNEELEP